MCELGMAVYDNYCKHLNLQREGKYLFWLEVYGD